MKKLLLSALTAVLFMIPTGLFAAGDEDSYIITVKDDAVITEHYLEKYDLTPLTTEGHGVYVTDAANAKKIENHSAIAVVEESNCYYLAADFNDPQYNTYQKWYFDAIRAFPICLNVSASSYRPTIVVIDTGFNFNHEDAKGGHFIGGSDIIAGINPYTGEYYKLNKDYFDHGTACAGVIGAVTNNNKGIAGLASQCDIVVISVFVPDQKGEPVAYDQDIIAAIYEAVDTYDADVISMSFGGTYMASAAETALEYAKSQGVILVAASGNEGTGRNSSGTKRESPLEYPAAFDAVIGVANINSTLKVDDSSSANRSVYISAPGTGIRTLDSNSTAGYASFTGTSLATPMVAALAGLAKCIDPDITQEEFKYYLRLTATDIESNGYDTASGYGIINFTSFLNTLSADQQNTIAGDGTAASPYILYDEEDLRGFELRVSSGETDACARLGGDITVSANFQGIDTTYNGTFEGLGYSICGLKDPLFDYIGTYGTVQNLIVSGNINDNNDHGLIANDNYGTIQYCTSEGSISSDIAAGICGYNMGTINGCTNRAQVSGIFTAGIAANCHSGSIAQCSNFGNISSTQRKSGGICSQLTYGASITNCYNVPLINGTTQTGGIVNNISGATVKNCYYADISGAFASANFNIAPKSPEYMKTEGFVCMLNNGQPYFTTDENNINNGFPVLGPTTLTSFFYDVPGYEWFADSVYELAADGILQGRTENYFYPNEKVTRAEFMTILAKINGTDLTDYEGEEPFTDVSPTDWFYPFVTWAYEQELAYGKGDNIFDPNAPMTREEVCCFIMRYLRSYSSQEVPAEGTLHFTDAYLISDWAKEDVAALSALSIINGFPDGSFVPQNPALRSQATLMTYKMLEEL